MTGQWGADANVLGWQKADVGGSGTTGATLAAVRTHLIDTYLTDGLGPYGKFFDGGGGWHTAYSNFNNSGYGAKANERHPVICAKVHSTGTFNTLMTDMHNALPAGEIWYACFFSEPEDDFNSGTLTHSAYQSAWASMDTLRSAHAHGAQVKFIPILMAYQEISGTSHWSTFLSPVLSVADVIGWDVYDDNGDPQSWSFATDIYPAIQALQTTSGLPWAIPEYGLQVSTHSGSTDNAAGVLSRWEAMVATCDADPDFLWGNYWMDGPHAANQRSAVIRTDTANAAYLTSLVAADPPIPTGWVAFGLDTGWYRGVWVRLFRVTTIANIPADALWTSPTNSTDNRSDGTGMQLEVDLFTGDPGEISWVGYGSSGASWDHHSLNLTSVFTDFDGTLDVESPGAAVAAGSTIYLAATQIPLGHRTPLPLDAVTNWNPRSDMGTWTLADGTTHLVPWHNADLVEIPVTDGPPSPPGNDLFDNATLLTDISGTIAGTTEWATIQGSEPTCPAISVVPTNTVWYQLVGHTGLTPITVHGTGPYTLDLFTSVSGFIGGCVNVASDSGTSPTVSYTTTSGAFYYIRVGVPTGETPTPFTLLYGDAPTTDSAGAIDLPLTWTARVPDVSSSQPDSGSLIFDGNLDGHRLHLMWSAVAEVATDVVDPLDERHPPLERASFVMDAPTIDPDTGYPDDTWTHTLNRSLWGRLHLAINGRSRTLNRGFAFVPLNDADTEPFGDAEASFRLPGITEYDDTEAAPWHIKPLSKVRFFRRDMDGNDHTLYEGDVASVEPDGIQSEDGPPGIVVQCVGVLYRLDLLESTPPLNVLKRDYGGIIAGQINTKRESHALGIGAMHQPNTGINGVRSPDFSKLITGAVQDYLSNMIDDDGNQWTLKVVRPRTPKLVLKDTTTVDATVTYGTPGISVNLSKDYTAATTAVYGSGASGHSQWMGATFPYLTQGDRPTFPLGVGESFSPGDGQSGFAPLAAYLRRGRYGNVQSDDTYLAVDADNVKDFQDDAGLTESGTVSAQTWEAAFASGANSGTVQGASVRAIFSRSGTRKHVHNAQGAVTGRNQNFDPTVPRIEEYVPFGDGVTKALATRSARQIVNRAYPAGHSGEIVLTADPEEMSRYDLRSGMNIKVKHYKGDHVLLHITRRERDWTTGTVTLTVDEKGNDELTAAAIHQRDRDTSDLTRRHTHGKRKSRVFNDYGQWLSEDGAGEIPLMYQQAGLWNVQKVPASPSGSLERVFLAAGTGLTEHLLNQALNAETPNNIPGAARSCILITGQPIHPRALNRMEGMSTPLLNLPDGTSPWDKNHSVLRRKFEMIFAAGGPGQALGFFPHDDPGDGTDVNLSGLFEDGGSWQYGPTEHFWIWVALWSPVSCKIGGRIYPGAPG